MISDPITKATQVLVRDDGSEAMVTVTEMFGAGLHGSIDIQVHSRKSANHDWHLCSKDPHPDWLTMSVDDYVNLGRPEHLRTVSFAEIFKVSSLIGQSLSAVNGLERPIWQ